MTLFAALHAVSPMRGVYMHRAVGALAVNGDGSVIVSGGYDMRRASKGVLESDPLYELDGPIEARRSAMTVE